MNGSHPHADKHQPSIPPFLFPKVEMKHKKSPPGDKCRPGGLRGGYHGDRVKAPGRGGD